jgi:hypothetical protein
MSHATEPAGLPRSVQRPQRASVSALIILAYAVAVYLFFLAVLGYAAGFFSGLGVPKGIGQEPRAAVPVAVAVDLLLLLLFAVQHTVMARPWSSAAGRASCQHLPNGRVSSWPRAWCWRCCSGCGGRPGRSFWSLPGQGAEVLWAVYAAGWAIAVSSTFAVSHVDLFGLPQAWLHARHVRYSPPAFTERGLSGGSGIP